MHTKYRFLFPIFFLIILLGFVLIVSSKKNQMERKALETLDISNIVYDATITYKSNYDFHNDGIMLTAYIGIGNENIDSFFSTWTFFSDESMVPYLLYGGVIDDSYYQSFIPDDNMLLNIPQIKNGYFRFIDKNNLTMNYSEENILAIYDSASANFVLAIYDMDTEILYVMDYNS